LEIKNYYINNQIWHHHEKMLNYSLDQLKAKMYNYLLYWSIYVQLRSTIFWITKSF